MVSKNLMPFYVLTMERLQTNARISTSSRQHRIWATPRRIREVKYIGLSTRRAKGLVKVKKLYVVDKLGRMFEIKYTMGNLYHVYRANGISKNLEIKSEN